MRPSRTWTWAVVAGLFLAVGCGKKGNGGGSGAPAAADENFAGVYITNWGMATMTQSGSNVTCNYARGNMSCQASGATLNCDWHEGATAGKALLRKQPTGQLVGTWGNASSSTNGGAWIFTPKK